MYVPVYVGDGILEYRQHTDPCIDEYNTVLIEVESCGICGTDLNILATPPMHKANTGIVIGHEAVGRVKKLSVQAKQAGLCEGDRVLIAPRILCNTCKYCRMGLQNQCTNYTTVGTTREGAFAPLLAIPHSAVYVISEKLTIEQAVLFEPLSCVVGAVRPVPFQLGDSVVIVGAGPMGALFALMYKAMGAGSISMIDLSEKRLDYMRSLGFQDCINPQKLSDSEFQEFCGSQECDIAVDAVGNQLGLCLSVLRRGASCILFGLKPQQKKEIEQYQITRNEHRIYGSFVGLFPYLQTIKILESQVLDPSVLVSHRLGLASLMEGIELMRNADGMKIIIDIKNSSS